MPPFCSAVAHALVTICLCWRTCIYIHLLLIPSPRSGSCRRSAMSPMTSCQTRRQHLLLYCADNAPHRASQHQQQQQQLLADLEPLLSLLGIPHLSEVLEPAPPCITPTQPEPHRPLSMCLAAALPLVQRHLAAQLRPADFEVCMHLTVYEVGMHAGLRGLKVCLPARVGACMQ